VLRWRRESAIQTVPVVRPNRPRPGPLERECALQPGTEKLLELPQKRRQLQSAIEVEEEDEAALLGKDPYKLLDAVSFSLKLRQVAEYSDALDDASRILHPSFDPPPRDRSADPSRRGVDRAKVKLDMVGLAIDRRFSRRK
jgi:hypothetical protein